MLRQRLVFKVENQDLKAHRRELAAAQAEGRRAARGLQSDVSASTQAVDDMAGAAADAFQKAARGADDLSGEFKDLEKHGAKAKRAFDSIANEAEKSARRSTGAWDGFFTKMRGFFAAGIAAIVARKIGQIGAYYVNLSAKIEETASKFGVVMGESAKEADKFLERWTKVAGVTQTQGRDMISTYAAMIQGMGATQQAASEMSQELVTLTGDLSSFFNISRDEAFTKIAAGLTGEAEPLKRLGIVLRENEVAMLALKQTGKATASDLTELEKTTARMALMFEKAGVANGDLERTMDSTQNRIVQIRGRFASLQETIAKELNPAIADTVAALDGFTESGDSIGVVQKFVGGLVMTWRLFVNNVSRLPDELAVAFGSAKGLLQGFMGSLTSAASGIAGTLSALFAALPAGVGSGASQQFASVSVGLDRMSDEFAKKVEQTRADTQASADASFKKYTDFLQRMADESADTLKNLGGGNKGGGIVPTIDLSGVSDLMASLKSALADETLAPLLDDLMKVKAQIAELTKAKDALAKAGKDTSEADSLLAVLEGQRQELELQISAYEQINENAKNLRSTISGTAQLMNGVVLPNAKLFDQDAILADASRLSNAVKQLLEERANAEQIVFRFGADSEEAKRALEDVAGKAKQVKAISDSLFDAFKGQVPEPIKTQLAKAMEAYGKQVKEAKEDTKDLSEVFDSLADAGRSLLNLVDVFGDLNGGVRDFARGMLDAIDNAGNLAKAIKAAKDADGPLSAAGALGIAVPAIGVASGVASAIKGFIDSQKEQSRAIIEAQQKLRDSLAENWKEIRSAVNDLLQSDRFGADLSGTARQNILDQWNKFQYDPGSPLTVFDDKISALANEMDFQNLIDALQQAGVITEQIADTYREQYKELRDSGIDFDSAILRLMPGLADIINSSVVNFGDFNDSIDGVIAQIRFFGEFLGVQGPDAIKMFAQNLLANVDGLSTQLIEMLQGILSGSVDVSSDDFKRQVEEFFRVLAEGSAEDRAALLGNLSATDFEKLFRELFDLAGGDVAQSTDEMRSGFNSASDAVRIFTNLMQGEAADAIRLFLDTLLGAGGTMSKGLSKLLVEARSLDVTSNEGRARLEQIIRSIAQGLLDGTDFGIAASEVEGILSTLQGLLENVPTSDNPDGWTKNVAVQRVITDIQGNEVIIRLSELRFQNDEMIALDAERNALLASIRDNIYQLPVAWSVGQAAPTNVNIGVNVTVPPNIDMIDEMLGDAVRKALINKLPA